MENKKLINLVKSLEDLIEDKSLNRPSTRMEQLE